MDQHSADYCLVDFSKVGGGNVRLEILNLGRVYNDYTVRLR